MSGAEVASAAFGIASALSWGAGDFLGGVAAKRADVNGVVIGAYFISAVIFLALALASGEPPPPAANLIWCGVAGLVGSIGLLALYRALAVGRMGVAAPVSGVLSAAVPVAAGVFFLGLPRPLTLFGFALALVAVWLIARTGDATFSARDLGLPIVAGLGFGFFITIIGRASAGAVYWPLVAARVASLTVLTGLALATGRPWTIPSRHMPIVALAGLFDGGGNAFLVVAANTGRLDIAAVLASLYPAGTVMLARWILKERMTPWQLAGLATALAAIVAITLP